MNRRFLALIVLLLAASTFFVFTRSIAVAAPPTQVETPDATAVEAISPTVPLSPTIRVQIRQRIPFTMALAELMPAAMVTATGELTATGAITGAGAITATTEPTVTDAVTDALTAAASMAAGDVVTFVLDLELDFLVSQTMTMTVPATLTIMHAGGMTDTITGVIPISLELGVSPTALVTVTALAVEPEAAESDAVTVTEVLTVDLPVTVPTVTDTTAITAPAVVTATTDVTTTPDLTGSEAITTPGSVTPATAVTANVRSGPGTDFDVTGTLPADTPLDIAGVSEDGFWYLLRDATWIFGELVVNPPDDAPLATPELIAQVTADAAGTTATPEPEATTTPAPDAEATPVSTDTGTVVTPTVTVDANLRAGPGTQFEVIGGTVTGEALTILGQNETGEWFLLNNGGWVFAALVANPPADAPVVPDDATPESVAAGAQGAPATANPLLPTPTPSAGN